MIVMKGNNHEPNLCLNCPLTWAWKQEAVKRLMEKQYTREKEEPSAHRICMERRTILKELGLECPNFPQIETLDYHTNETFKEQIDQRNELRKRQNITHFL